MNRQHIAKTRINNAFQALDLLIKRADNLSNTLMELPKCSIPPQS